MGKDIVDRILAGLSDKNIRFEDLKRMLMSFGFDCRIKGDHHIFSKEGVAEIINLQPLEDGKSKPYQVRQVRGLILKYKLHKGAKDV
jgi:hypothetical protein